jgi:Mg-chelatase subunit ChlD
MNEAVAVSDSPAENPNNFELNKGDNFIFGVDVSGSMATSDCPGGKKRIDFLKEKTIQFANEASKWDTDGIDVITFGSKITPYSGVTAEKAAELIGGFQANEGSTDTAGLITAAYGIHKAGGYEQTTLFIATDGAPNSKDEVIKAIADITNDVKDEREFNISFLTVGKIDAGLRAFLDVLDDALPGAKYDIVDVKELESVDFEAAFMGALND